MKASSQQTKLKLYGLVRDGDGKPVIDDKDNIPDPIWGLLTQKEQQEINYGRYSSNSN